MSDVVEMDLRQWVLASGAFGQSEIQRIRAAMAEDTAHFRALREGVQELEVKEFLSESEKERLGICYYLMGRFERAVKVLEQPGASVQAEFYTAKACFATEQFRKALKHYEAAAAAGFDSDACTLGRAEALRYLNDNAAALAAMDELFGAVEQTAEYLYQRGATVAALGGNPREVVALYERAVEADPKHCGALFGLALENDRYGNDDMAVRLYERSVAQFPPHVGSLLNLGVLYEDGNRYSKAQGCYRRILAFYPDQPRARLFVKDADASSDMFYDEEAQRKRDRLSQILGVPVTDFELSVRSRNCLQKMGIMTLGDLTNVSEPELLASKNFGETSLVELKEMMAAKGLELGQFSHESETVEPPYEPESMTPDEQALLSRPLADLNLSVRARKCMVRLGVTTIGELARHTGDELLEIKNFGVTSLTEVREKLTVQGLKLRND